MKSVCDTFGIRFMAILQPWIGSELTSENIYLKQWFFDYWNVVYPQFVDFLDNAETFKSQINKDLCRYSWLKDFTSIFGEIENQRVYFDSVHVNELGNSIVAQNVYQVLRNEMYL